MILSVDQSRDYHPAPAALTDADWYWLAAGRGVISAAQGVGRFGLHLVFGVDRGTDDRASYPPLAVTQRYRVSGCRGVLRAAEGVARRIFWSGAGLQAASLGAEHLNDAACDHAHARCKQAG